MKPIPEPLQPDSDQEEQDYEDVYDGTIGRSAILQQSIMRRQPLGGSGGASVSCVGLCSLLVCDTCGVIFTLMIVSFVMILLG